MSKVCDTSFLLSQCENDQEMFLAMIDLFKTNAPIYMKKIQEAFQERKAEELKDGAHAFLSSLKLMGAHEAVEITKRIETKAMEGKVEDLGEQVDLLSVNVEKALEEVKKIG